MIKATKERNKKASAKIALTRDLHGTFYYSMDYIQEIAKKGIISPDLAMRWQECIARTNTQAQKYNEFKKNNPNATQDQENAFWNVPRQLDKEEQTQLENETNLLRDFHMLLTNHFETLTAQSNKGLFNKVNLDISFGVSSSKADLMAKLKELVDGAELRYLGGITYEITGTTENSYGEKILLKYDFNATTHEGAKELYAYYKNIMIRRGLKILLAYWRVGNELKRTAYECPMIEIMKRLKDKDVKTKFFSVQAKREHWAITKMLSRTNLSIEKKISKGRTRWYQYPLLTILGGEKEDEALGQYPETVAIRVLDTSAPPKGFVPRIYKNRTLLTDPNDAYLSFMIQTKASRECGAEQKYDWPFLFSYGVLEDTAKTNVREAKAKIRKKLDRLKENEEIEGWREVPGGIAITPCLELYKFHEENKYLEELAPETDAI